MAQENYRHWKGEGERGTVVVRKRRNPIYVPPELEGAKQNHVYMDVVDEDGQPGRAYVAQSYEHQPYPKMLFHPNYHLEDPPNRNHFKETQDWEAAMRKWKRDSDRTQLADNAKEEKRLVDKGWLVKPPERPMTEQEIDAEAV